MAKKPGKLDKHGHNFVIFSQAIGQTWNHTSAYHLSTLAEYNEDRQGIALDEFIKSNALFQLIDQPMHILENSKSCIDLIITNQPSLFVESGVQPSLFKDCHHEIIFGKVAVSVPHPPPYKRRMWD